MGQTTNSTPATASSLIEPAEIGSVLDEMHLSQSSNLIDVLQEVQRRFGYLPQDALLRISRRTRIPLSRIYGVVSFYAQFYTEPRGRHMIRCCRGTACHVRGGKKLIESTEQILGIADGQTTDDMLFTLETVACLGACALAPVVTVDGKYHGKVTVAKMRKIVDACVEQAHQ